MKFTIRDLLLVTVIVALAAAWWVDRSTLAKSLAKQKHPIKAYNGPPVGPHGIVGQPQDSGTRPKSAQAVTRGFSSAD